MAQWPFMRAATRGFAALGLLGALTATSGAGCANEVEPTSQVAPNALPKSMFVRRDADGAYRADSDSWYMRGTIIDIPTTNSAAFIGAASEMSRIKWKIEERFLLAVREDPDILNSGDKSGGIIAAFPILSHFDIRRDYNPGTGEEMNILVENVTDRPWDQRDYIRVDWSTNTISAKQWSFPGLEQISAASYYVQDTKDKDAPVFENDYFDFTARYTIWPDIETCFYTFRDFNCGPSDISARVSFMKVPAREFVPREYPDRITITDKNGDPIRTLTGSPVSVPMFDQYGVFRTERAVYDQRFGALEKKYIYRMNQWNLWTEWFKKGPDGKVLKGPDGKEVLLPYSERKVRPIVYFLNAEWPKELHATAEKVANQWNDAFSEAVASARLLEKKGGAALQHAELRAEVDAMGARGERVFVLCKNNPVQKGDPKECGAEGTVARIGDQRFSFMYWVHKPQGGGLLGFGPSYADPITGEIFSAAAYEYGGETDRYAQSGVEVVNLLQGKWTEFDYANGIHTDVYAKHLAAGEVPGSKESAAIDKPAPTPGSAGFDLAKLLAQVDKSIDRPLLNTIQLKGIPIATGGSAVDTLARIKGTKFERLLFDNPELKPLIGKAKEDKLDDADVRKIFESVAGRDIVKRDRKRLEFLGKHGCYFTSEFADDAVIGIAKELAEKYGKGESPAEEEAIQLKIWQELRERILLGLAEHEVGHTLGLRHNFEGSIDAMNFHDQFWKLKGETPKYGEPMTEAQKAGKMTEYQYSTVMDYGSRFNSDVQGLGKYDYAAIRFAYGDVVEAWAPGTVVDPLYNAPPGKFKQPLFNGYSADVLQRINKDFRHYTQLPKQLKNGTKSLAMSGRELRRFSDVVANATALYQANVGKSALVKTGSFSGADATKAIDVVPYRFCSDELADTTDHPLCHRWDTGLDQFEIVRDAMDRYRQYYIFDAFSRGRVNGFSVANNYLGKLVTRYFLPVQQQYAHWMFFQAERSKIWTDVLNADGMGVANGYISNPDWFKDPAGGLPATVATYWGLDRLVDVLGTPDIGVYQDYYSNGNFIQLGGVYACGSGPNPVACKSNSSQLVLDLGSGARYLNTQYERGTGSSYFMRIANAGGIYDKIAALLAMTYDETNFIGRDQTNALGYRVGFYLAYPKALTAVFGGIASETYDNYAWRWTFEGGKAKLLSPDVFATRGALDGVPEPGKLSGQSIDSQWYFFYKAYALYFTMALYKSSFAQSYNDAIRVFCTGCGEAFTPGPGTTVVNFTDPLSGKEYAAVDYGVGRFSPGAAMVRKGQELVKAYDEAIKRPSDDPDRSTAVADALSSIAYHVETLDLVRGLYAEYGSTTF
jgi:hypothetical protein